MNDSLLRVLFYEGVLLGYADIAGKCFQICGWLYCKMMGVTIAHLIFIYKR